MKKYYTHTENKQNGPFDLTELKSQKISKETPIWYEGLPEWTKAGEIPELSELFRNSTPPPINPNSFSKNESSKPIPPKSSISEPKKNKPRAWLWILIALFLVISVITGIIVVNNPNAVPGVRLEINTPKPVIVSSRADGKNSGIFNARTTVYATVMNQGGSGNVLVTFYVYQGGNTFDKSKSIYLGSNQSEDLEMIFEEVDYISGDITYNVDAVAQ